MKAYMVVIDKWDDYGAQLYCKGVFSTYEEALRIAKKYQTLEYAKECIYEVELGKETDVYLGGYCE